MQTTQHSNTRYPVYLHPAACSSRVAIETIPHHIGRLVILPLKGRTEAIQPSDTVTVDDSTRPCGGDAA